jgi:hypothetical protein
MGPVKKLLFLMLAIAGTLFICHGVLERVGLSWSAWAWCSGYVSSVVIGTVLAEVNKKI